MVSNYRCITWIGWIILFAYISKVTCQNIHETEGQWFLFDEKDKSEPSKNTSSFPVWGFILIGCTIAGVCALLLYCCIRRLCCPGPAYIMCANAAPSVAQQSVVINNRAAPPAQQAPPVQQAPPARQAPPVLQQHHQYVDQNYPRPQQQLQQLPFQQPVQQQHHHPDLSLGPQYAPGQKALQQFPSPGQQDFQQFPNPGHQQQFQQLPSPGQQYNPPVAPSAYAPPYPTQ